ncbi:ecdysone 20-monooxygenase [Diorhabda carinulata]|uniref:ecdysone 20-monooxygenase n=1 Tax=Diorhabda carinulata TaxID=1163345 RepID=UPI0025A2CA76|nr:ecdysone 20-monooxygenase [Diorhabda carinulata]XP_057668184.1 ecdysone 20-monooxygenase [Diorhabda carinulata]XP_057668185.1 ecdysone 20-monooxygenase [Diorhabda carinulata]
MINEIIFSFSTFNYIFVIVAFILFGYGPPWWNRKNIDCLRNNVHDIPGPLSLPFLGTRWMFTFGGYSFGKIHEFYVEMYEKYGPIVKEEALFNIPVISVYEKIDIEKVFKSTGKYPIRPPTEAVVEYRRSRPDRYASTGLVNEQGTIWHHLRTSLTTNITSPKTIYGFLPQMQVITEDFCNLIKQKRQNDSLIADLDEIVNKMGLETSCALVLGRRLGFMLPGEESEIAKMLAEAIHQNFIAIRDTYFGLPIWKFFKTSAYKRLAESEETIYNIASELIRNVEDSTKESAIFQSVLNANIDEREKTAAIVDFIAAGIHTLKNSLVFLLYLVAKHPGTQEKILEDSSGAYLKACVMESFRVLPTANCLARITEEDLELSGYKVKAGSVVICQTGVACRNEKYFPNASEFRPERWLKDQKNYTLNNSPFLVSPFGIGRRICPGKRFIEHVLPIIVENIVKNFEIEIVRPMELQFEFLLSPKGPTAMIFKDRV